MSKSAPVSKTQSPLEKLKEILNKRWEVTSEQSASGVDVVYKTFRLFDKNRSESLNGDEFERMMCTLLDNTISRADSDSIFGQIDGSKDGYISYDEFINSFHNKLSNKRIMEVKNIFDKLDKNRSGSFTSKDMNAYYSEAEANKILKSLIGPTHNVGRSEISKKEFIDYYTDLSMRIKTDEEFIQIIRTAWASVINSTKKK